MWGSVDLRGVLVFGLVVGAVWCTAWHGVWCDVWSGARCVVLGVLCGALRRVWRLAWCLGSGVLRSALFGAWCNCGVCVCACARGGVRRVMFCKVGRGVWCVVVDMVGGMQCVLVCVRGLCVE